MKPLSEVVSQGVNYVNQHLITKPRDKVQVNQPNREAGPPSLLTRPQAPEPLQMIHSSIYAKVETYWVFLYHPTRTRAASLGLANSDAMASSLYFYDEGNDTLIQQPDLCVYLDEWNPNRRKMQNLHTYVVSDATVLAVSPSERQPAGLDSVLFGETLFVNRAYRKEALVVVDLAKKAVDVYEAAQKDRRNSAFLRVHPDWNF